MKTKLYAVIFLGVMFVLSFRNSYSQILVCQTSHTGNSEVENAFNRYVVWFKKQGKHLNTDLKIIPVVIHVIYRNSADSQQITMARVRGQIDATNKHLRRLNDNANETRAIFLPVVADCNVQVCLATRKPDRTEFSGVIYHSYPDFVQSRDLAAIRAATIIDPESYLNVWILPDDIQASAVFPWNRTAIHDGFYIGSRDFGIKGSNLNPYTNLGATFTHELGHYLGLEHPFQNSTNFRGRCDLIHDGSIGDFCGDTPLTWEFDFIGETCSEGLRACNETPPDFIIAQTENYMDYNPDRCLNMFSKDQRARVRACLNSLRFRLTLPSNLKRTGVICKDLRENCNGCSTPLSFKADNNDLQVDKQSMEKKITIFPNPANSIVNISYNNLPLSKGMGIDLYNQTGQKLQEVHSNTTTNELNLSSYAQGVYYIRITIGNTSITKYIIKAGR